MFNLIFCLLENATEPKDSNAIGENLSVTVKIEEDENDVIDIDANDNTSMDEDEIDPKDVWRVGYPFKEFQLFLRPATVSKLSFEVKLNRILV